MKNYQENFHFYGMPDISYSSEFEILQIFFIGCGKENEEYCFSILYSQSSPVYIELNDQSYGCKEGIEKIILGQKQIRFQLNENGKNHIHYSEIIIDFDLEGDIIEYDVLKAELIKIFKDKISESSQ